MPSMHVLLIQNSHSSIEELDLLASRAVARHCPVLDSRLQHDLIATQQKTWHPPLFMSSGTLEYTRECSYCCMLCTRAPWDYPGFLLRQCLCLKQDNFATSAEQVVCCSCYCRTQAMQLKLAQASWEGPHLLSWSMSSTISMS